MDFQRLYELQDEALRVLQTADTGFYLSGGTAASRGYLHHRYSEDLDLFVNDSSEFGLWADRIIVRIARSSAWETDVTLRDPRFVRLFLNTPNISLKIEMINDVPSHVGKIVDHPQLGRLDSAENILANKLSALVDREEPKDLADIWGFCARMNLSIEKALAGAQGKAAGLFPVDVARRLSSTQRADWEQVQWIEPPAPDIFQAEIHRIAERLLLLPNVDST